MRTFPPRNAIYAITHAGVHAAIGRVFGRRFVVPLCIFALVCPHACAMDTGSFGTPVAPGSAGLTSLEAGAAALGFVHHRSAQAAEYAACTAVDAAAVADGRKSRRIPFRRNALPFATRNANGQLGEVKSATWSTKRMWRAAVQPNCLPVAGSFSPPCSANTLLQVDDQAAALEQMLRRWYPPATNPWRNLRPITNEADRQKP